MDNSLGVACREGVCREDNDDIPWSLQLWAVLTDGEAIITGTFVTTFIP